MYHAVSWILFSLDRARALPRQHASRLRWRLLGVHAVPLAVNAALWPTLGTSELQASLPLVYLFWSVAHAFQTALSRGFEPATTARA